MRKHRTRDFVSTALLVLCVVFAPFTAFGNWGMEVGRASEGDQVRLLSDWTALKMAETRLKSAVQRNLAKERQLQLLGLSDGDGSSAAALLDGVYVWFMNEVLAPAQRIGMNPAASCEEAKLAMSLLLGMMRQRALVGIVETPERDEELSQIFAANREITMQRCRDEALDECNGTGRFMQIPQLKFAAERQAELLGSNADFTSWVDEALQQCAMYELHFVSTTKVAMPTVETVRDGRVAIKFEAPGGAIMDAVMGGKALNEVLKGQTKDSPFFVSIKCALPGNFEVSCSPGANSDPVRSGIVTLDLQHREFYVDPNGISRMRTGVGEDKFSFEFAGGIFALDAVVKAPNFSQKIPFPAHGFAFFIAHKKDVLGTGAGQGTGVKVDRNTRGAYPVLFKFTYAGQGNVGGASISDSTEFELIHKPKPKPFPLRRSEPIRKPLIPRPGAL
jgi:hypothetical protein